MTIDRKKRTETVYTNSLKEKKKKQIIAATVP